MRINHDLLKGKWVQNAGYSGLVERVDHKRGDTAVMEAAFFRGADAAALTGEVTEMVYVVKASFEEDAPSLLLANNWTLDDETGIWSSPLTMDVEALMEELGGATYKDLKGEFTFTTTTMGTSSSQTIIARVGNDVWKGTEGTPLSLPTPDEWLAARRPAPIARTAAQGPPVDGVYQTETITIGEFETWPVNVHSMAWDGQDPIEITSGSLAPAGAASLTASLKNNMLAQAAIAAEWNITSAGAVITMVRKTLGPLTGFSFSRTSGTALSVVSVEEVAGVTGTPATALDQACIVGDAGKNKLEYRAVQMDPVQWQLVTAGVIWNEDEEQFEKLVVRDGTLQTDVYSLS